MPADAPRDVGALVARIGARLCALSCASSRGSTARRAATAADLGAYADAALGLDARVVGDVLAFAGWRRRRLGVDATRLFPAYLAALEQLARVHRRLARANDRAWIAHGLPLGAAVAAAVLACCSRASAGAWRRAAETAGADRAGQRLRRRHRRGVGAELDALIRTLQARQRRRGGRRHRQDLPAVGDIAVATP